MIERYGRFMMFYIAQITDRLEGMLPLITSDGDLCGRILSDRISVCGVLVCETRTIINLTSLLLSVLHV